MLNVSALKQKAQEELSVAQGSVAVETLRVKYLGRKGELTAALRKLKDMSLDERRVVAPKLQSLKRELEELFDKKFSNTQNLTPKTLLDLTAPGKRLERGHLHPLTLVDREIREIFMSMNFSVVEGPEIETEYYNFDALNIPAGHPARDMWDTFWIKSKIKNQKSKLLLRTHTSPGQAHYLETHRSPFQIIVPGRCYRYEATDASHQINFYQFEGMMVGKRITLANFKFVVEAFFKKFFAGQTIEFRYRPSYFPFTEPSVEVDVKYRGTWLEMMGAGMVNRRVFEYAHLNPTPSADGWQGFAFGCGIDRLAMIKYKVPDIRLFYSGDLRFVKQF